MSEGGDTDAPQMTTYDVCSKCGVVYDGEKIQCPVCANRGIIDQIRNWIEDKDNE